MSGTDSMTARSGWRLAALHARYQVVETIRVPIAVIATMLFPGASLLFFVVPQPAAHDPLEATAATAQLTVFAVLSVCLFTCGAGVAEDRALPWDTYLRTLPVGPLPRLIGRVVNGLVFTLLGLLPVIVVARLFTAATLPLDRLLVTVGALLVSALPLLGAGMAIGYSFSPKAALAVSQLLLLPLAFGGGLFLPPSLFPGWLDLISLGTPTRIARDLVTSAATGTDLPGTTWPVLVGWAIVASLLAVRAYRRDEATRFR